jgi:hypothetical protein
VSCCGWGRLFPRRLTSGHHAPPGHLASRAPAEATTAGGASGSDRDTGPGHKRAGADHPDAADPGNPEPPVFNLAGVGLADLDALAHAGHAERSPPGSPRPRADRPAAPGAGQPRPAPRAAPADSYARRRTRASSSADLLLAPDLGYCPGAGAGLIPREGDTTTWFDPRTNGAWPDDGIVKMPAQNVMPIVRRSRRAPA